MAKPGIGMIMVDQDMLLPHEAFAGLYHDYPQVFVERVVGPPGRLPDFWKAVQHHPMLAGHELLRRKGYQQVAVPISLHGDGVPIAGVGKATWKLC